MSGVNRSWSPRQRLPAPATSLEGDTRLRDTIERLRPDFPGDGCRRVTAQLHRDGWTVNHKRVPGIMQNEGLPCRSQEAFRPLSAGSTRAAYSNLAHVLDAFSRRVIGWHLSRDTDTRLTLAAPVRA